VGSYGGLDGGNVEDALHSLTGAATMTLDIKRKTLFGDVADEEYSDSQWNDEALWQRLYVSCAHHVCSFLLARPTFFFLQRYWRYSGFPIVATVRRP